MSISLKIKKGLDLNIEGEIEDKHIGDEIIPDIVAVCPDDFPGIIPKPEVKEGDRVLAGQALLDRKSVV